MKITGDIKERQSFYPQCQVLPLAEHPFYTSSFSIANKEPQWVCYRRTPGRETKTVHRDGTPVEQLLNAMLGRFHEDPLILGSLDASAYDGSGFDTGHLCPAESMMFDRQALADTFLTSNAMPQYPGLNRGTWKSLEAKESAFSRNGATLDIICGPYYANVIHKKLASGISIPDSCWKVIAEPATKKIVAYLMPNSEHPAADINLFQVPIAQIAKLTGISFPAWSSYADDKDLLTSRSKLLKLDNPNTIQPNTIQIEDLMNGEYVLLSNYIFNPNDIAFPNARIIVPKGFTTDFGSIPQVFTNIYPKIGTFRDKCFLGHDWLYGTEYFEWKDTAYKYVLNASDDQAECDMRLLESLKADGDNWISRNTIYSAVRTFGGNVWAKHTPESIKANRDLLINGGLN